FSFSHFHFAHAQNHLQLVSIEWIPLALLGVSELLMRPTVLKGVAAAGGILLTTLSDFYFTLWVVIAGVVLGSVVLVALLRAGNLGRLRSYVAPICVFVALTCASTGVFAFKLIRLNRADRLLNSHDAVEFSTDIIDPFVPSAQWRFSHLTERLWSRVAHEDYN